MAADDLDPRGPRTNDRVVPRSRTDRTRHSLTVSALAVVGETFALTLRPVALSVHDRRRELDRLDHIGRADCRHDQRDSEHDQLEPAEERQHLDRVAGHDRTLETADPARDRHEGQRDRQERRHRRTADERALDRDHDRDRPQRGTEASQRADQAERAAFASKTTSAH